VTPRRYGEGRVYVRQEASGAESFYGRWYTPSGKRVHRKLGPKRSAGNADGLTVKQASAELRRRIDADLAAPVRPDRISFDAAAERAIAHFQTRPKRKLQRRTAATYLSAVKTHMSPQFGERPAAEIEAADVEKLMADMAAAGKADKTILNVYAPLSQIFDYAVSQGWRAANPCADVEAPTVAPRDEVEFLKPAEVDALLRGVDLSAEFGSTDRALYAAAAKAGLRQGELMALRWRHVDWAASRIRVRLSFDRKEDKAPKSKAGVRAVPLPDSLAAELDRHFKASNYTADDDRVFCHPATGKVLDHSDLSRRFKGALKAAKLRSIRFHDLRHTYGTRLVAAGVDLVKVKTWMGHDDVNTTMIYAHYAPDEDEAGRVEEAFAVPSSHSSSQVEQVHA
jgi:integrase